MADDGKRRSPLAPMAGAMAAISGAGGTSLREVPFQTQVTLRGNAEDAGVLTGAEAALGLALPLAPNSVAEGPDIAALWLGPDEWLIVAGDGRAPGIEHSLRAALAGRHVQIVDTSANRAAIELSGPKAREVLNKGCPLDLDARAFGPGRCAQSVLARAQILLRQTDETPPFLLYVRSSFAYYAASWLIDALREYRVLAKYEAAGDRPA